MSGLSILGYPERALEYADILFSAGDGVGAEGMGEILNPCGGCFGALSIKVASSMFIACEGSGRTGFGANLLQVEEI